MLAVGIKDIYLFTDMTTKKGSLFDRYLLVKYLEEVKGFKVHGVVTPPDMFFNRLSPREAMRIREKIHECKSTENIQSFVSEIAPQILIRKDNENNPIEFVPGKMYADAERFYFAEDLEELNKASFLQAAQKLTDEQYFIKISDKKNEPLDNLATVGKYLADFKASHPKAPLFEQFTASKSFSDHKFSSIFYADDNLDAVRGVATRANKNTKNPIPISIWHCSSKTSEKQSIENAINLSVTGGKAVFLTDAKNADLPIISKLKTPDDRKNAFKDIDDHLEKRDAKTTYQIMKDSNNSFFLMIESDKKILKIENELGREANKIIKDNVITYTLDLQKFKVKHFLTKLTPQKGDCYAKEKQPILDEIAKKILDLEKDRDSLAKNKYHFFISLYSALYRFNLDDPKEYDDFSKKFIAIFFRKNNPIGEFRTWYGKFFFEKTSSRKLIGKVQDFIEATYRTKVPEEMARNKMNPRGHA